jgi:hypothetical protein
MTKVSDFISSSVAAGLRYGEFEHLDEREARASAQPLHSGANGASYLRGK